MCIYVAVNVSLSHKTRKGTIRRENGCLKSGKNMIELVTDESRKCNIINIGCGSIQSGREEAQERMISQKKAVMKVPSENLLLCMLFF